MLKGKDLLSIHELSRDEVEEILSLAQELKEKQKAGIPHRLLEGKSLGMIFEKSSTRTRVSFEVGMYQLGGQALFLSSRDLQLGRGEPIKDTARVLSRYLDGIMIRTYGHERIEELAEWADVPVINALSDLLHPCQALTDLLSADAAGTSGLDLLAEVPGQMTLALRGQEEFLGHADLLSVLPDGRTYVGEPFGGRGVVTLPGARMGELAGRQWCAGGGKLVVGQLQGAFDGSPPALLVLAGLTGGELLEGTHLAS